jgi:nucleoid-associated protein YgaU
MRRDVKTGMLTGTVLCLAAIVWFCIKQQVIIEPLVKFESQYSIAQIEKENAGPEKDDLTIVSTKPAEKSGVLTYKSISPQTQKPHNSQNFIIHTVTQGQSLSDISKIYYDTPHGWKKIYEANKEQLSQGPDMVKTGMRIIIPQ